MSWEKIRTYSPETLELKRVSSYVLLEMSNGGVVTYHNSTFQIDFYQFLKRMNKKYKISPNEILCFLARQPQYIANIYRKNLGPLTDALLATSKQLDRRMISFVTLYYDNYFLYKTIFRAVLHTIRYPFDKFDLTFVQEVFATYPFLTDLQHLNMVLDKLKEKKYAYYITATGISEKY